MSVRCEVCDKNTKEMWHRFPSNDMRAQRWSISLQWQGKYENLKAYGLDNRSIRLCTWHFDSSQFINNDRSGRLKNNATPYMERDVVPYSGSEDDEEMPVLHRAKFEKRKFPSQDFTASQAVSSSQSDINEPFVEKIKRKKLESEQVILMPTYSILDNSQLLLLLDWIPGCLQCKDLSAIRSFSQIGSVLKMETDCIDCGLWEWTSSKKLSNDRQGSMFEVNVDYISASFTSGIPYERMIDFSSTMSLGIPCRSTQQKVFHKYGHEAVKDIYQQENDKVLSKLGNQLSLIGDAQFDSRGFSASICRYVVMDYDSRLTLDYEIMARQEAGGNSPRMELMCFERVVDRLEAKQSLAISSFTSDKNSSIVKIMRDRWPHVPHYLDKWHVHKNFNKCHDKEFKLKRNSALAAHREHILVHIWTSISAAKGNGELACELIRSAEFHLQDKHVLPKETFKLLQRCPHPITATVARSYLNPDIPKQAIQIKTTSPIESFHGVVGQIYMQKNIYYDKRTSETFMRMAILHYNQLKISHGEMLQAGKQPSRRTKFSRSQNRDVEILAWPKVTPSFKKEVLHRVREAYQRDKKLKLDTRKLGRPQAAARELLENNSSDESDFEEFILYSDNEEQQSEMSVTSDNEDEFSDEQPPSTSVFQPPKPRFRMNVNRRQFESTLEVMGSLYHEYQFFDEENGQELLPIMYAN